MKKTAVFLLMCVVFVALIGCSQGEPSHLGEWQSSITEEITLRIKSDGTIEEYWEDILTATYPYELGENAIIVDQSGDHYTLLLEGDALTYMGETLYTRK